MKTLVDAEKNGQLPPHIIAILKKFSHTYIKAIQTNNGDTRNAEALLIKFFELAAEHIYQPYLFQPYHQAIRVPFDYYQFGLDFIRPLVDIPHSTIQNAQILDRMKQQLQQRENVIFLANHQIEPDPQVLSILLEKNYPQIAEEMIAVAGHRVITDPLAVPFSKGRNLICIYSKKYIEDPPEEKQDKLIHNQKTMKQMGQLLSEGGKCIWVAPSGGRDRPNAKGQVSVAPFDPQSIELFYLIAKQAERPTHFYPVALTTYYLLPPPNSIGKEIGEQRYAQSVPAHIAFGEEIDMEHFPGCETTDKRQRRQARADYIWNLVQKDYQNIYNKINQGHLK